MTSSVITFIFLKKQANPSKNTETKQENYAKGKAENND